MIPFLFVASLGSQELPHTAVPEFAGEEPSEMVADRTPCPTPIIFDNSACTETPEEKMIEARKTVDRGCCPEDTASKPNDMCTAYEGIFANLFSARPCLANPLAPNAWGVRLDAAILCWQASEEGLEYAFNNSPRFTSGTFGTSTVRTDINGEYVGMKFDFAPGTRVNLGIDFPKNWVMDFTWTYFYSHSAHGTSEPVSLRGNGLFPLWLLPSAYLITPQVYSSAHGDWKIHFNTADWDLASSWFLTPKLSLRFNAGLKVLWINQDFSVKYANGPISAGNLQPLSAHAQMSNKAFGVGPRIGFTTQWGLTKGWSILGKIAGALPLYEVRTERTDFDVTVNTSNSIASVAQSKFREKIYHYRPNLECMAGFSWDRCFGRRNQFAFGWDIAYEVQYFWEQNLMPLLVADPLLNMGFSSRGDLTLQGATFNFRFGY